MPKESAADRALKRSQARGEIRKLLIETGAESQVRISRERGRQRRSVEKAKTTQRVAERQQSEAARVQAYAARAEIAQQQLEAKRVQRVQTQRDLMSLRDENKPSRVSEVGSSIGGSITSSTPWATLMTITTLFFVMIIVYVIVTNGQQFGSFASKAGSFIATLSSTKPIFVSNQ